MKLVTRRGVLSGGLAVGCAATAGIAANSAAAADDTKLDADSLGTMLTNMGLECEKLKNDESVVFHRARYKSGDFNFVVDFYVSPNGRFVWQVVLLGKAKDQAKIAQPFLLGLLRQNFKNGPNHFSLDETSGQVQLNFAFENRGITPVAFKKKLDDLTELAKGTVELWTTKALNGE